MTSPLNIAACILLSLKELDDLTKDETGEIDNAGGREPSVSEDMINIPSPIPELDELIQNDTEDKVCKMHVRYRTYNLYQAIVRCWFHNSTHSFIARRIYIHVGFTYYSTSGEAAS